MYSYGTSTGTWFSVTDFVVKGDSAAAQAPEVVEKGAEAPHRKLLSKLLNEAPVAEALVSQPVVSSPQTYDTVFVLSCVILLSVGICVAICKHPAKQRP